MSFVGRKVNIQFVMYNVMRTVEMLSLLKIRSAVSLKRHVKNSELKLRLVETLSNVLFINWSYLFEYLFPSRFLFCNIVLNDLI